MVEALVFTIRNRTVGEQRREARANLVQKLLRPSDVQVSLLLSGKGRVRQVLSRRAASDRNIYLAAVLLLHGSIFLENLLPKLGGEWGIHY